MDVLFHNCSCEPVVWTTLMPGFIHDALQNPLPSSGLRPYQCTHLRTSRHPTVAIFNGRILIQKSNRKRRTERKLDRPS